MDDPDPGSQLTQDKEEGPINKAEIAVSLDSHEMQDMKGGTDSNQEEDEKDHQMPKKKTLDDFSEATDISIDPEGGGDEK